MLTDPAPHNSDVAGFRESDRMTTLDLPENDGWPAIARSIETATKRRADRKCPQSLCRFRQNCIAVLRSEGLQSQGARRQAVKGQGTMDDGALRRLRS